ncbi:adenosine deaminase [Egicoccus sp. AB-alg2]|uniref:adenosine deaminase n=1 Tax=Egicoccus sp. AB-alg2 TaxID=3242693 RepID=UPI00359D7DBC
MSANGDGGSERLPKAHLHLHLEGAARPATLVEYARRRDVPAASLEGFTDLAAFVVAYETARDLIGSLDELQRVAREVAEDALEQGCVWIEVHFAPFSYGGRLGREEALLEAVLAGLAEPQGDATGAAVVLAVNRAHGTDLGRRTLVLAERYAGRGVVGLGLVGDERHPARPYAPLFARAREAGLLAVPHAGETQGPHAVLEALQLLRADRIGHGITATRDPGLLEQLADTQRCLDVCPTSNLRLGVAEDWSAHPIHRLVAAGVAVSLNSDDPTFFGSDVAQEYATAAAHGLPVAAIAAHSLRHSAAPDHVRGPALRALASQTTPAT